MDIVNEFLVKTHKEVESSRGYNYIEIRPRIVCEDGFSLSVQASDGHYCNPRHNESVFYDKVEVGYPSKRPPNTWREYFDGEWEDTGVLGYFKRLLKDRGHIWYAIKECFNKKITKTWRIQYLKSFLSLKDNATGGVYGYVPTKLVCDVIEEHGGIDWEKTIK
jgi:hypothetical protein